MDTIKGILGDGAEDKIKSVIGSFSADSGSSAVTGNSPSADSMEYILQMRDIMNKMTSSTDDKRSRLLSALKPYMNESRQRSIDSAVKLLNIAKIAEIFRQ